MRSVFMVFLLSGLFALSARGASGPSVILDDSLPGQDARVTQSLRGALFEAGEEPETIKAASLNSPDALKDAGLLVLPSARSVPLAALPAIDLFLNNGGRLIACNLPLCEDGVFESGGKFLARRDVEGALAHVKPANMLARFDADEIGKWKRSTNSDKPDVVESVEEKALHVSMPQLIGWDTLSREYDHPFPQDHTLTCFRAKGAPGTSQLAVEWQETDGSRWIATVPVTTEWRDYAVAPESFAPWQLPNGRGGVEDHFNPSKARRFAVGLAFSHTQIERSPQEYWFADLGTAASPFALSQSDAQRIHIEGLCPSYQFYPITGASKLRSPDGQGIVIRTEAPAPSNLIALHPRPSGTGFGKNRAYRWQSLLDALSDKNEFRGTVAAMIVPTAGPRAGSAWACFTPGDPDFYARPEVNQMITSTVRALRRGVFLREGGASAYTQFDDLAVTLGARAIRLKDANGPSELLARVTVTQPGKDDPVYKKDAQLTGPEVAFSEQWKPRGDEPWPEQGFTVTTELLMDDMIVDRLVHRLYGYRIKPESPHHVSIDNGHFELDGKLWRPNGVNYMPSSGIGLDDGEVFEHWIGSAGYDPEIVDRDLRRIKAMNLNAISVFIYYKSLPAWNLIDLLRRCEQYGIKVNLSLRPGTPIDFDWDQWKAIIEKQRLAKIDTIFAYDLAWEWTHWGRDYQQKYYTAAWRKWVNKRYGSLDSAEKSWGLKVPRAADGELDVPESKQLFDDGDWRKLAIDYRAFLDEFIAGRYGGARDLVRSIDPNHFVSFRMNIAGDPTARDENNLAYDFWGLRGGAVDIFEPEAYGRIGDWGQIQPGQFTVSYARLCDPNKPVVWAEMGVSVCDRKGQVPTPDKLRFQAKFVKDFYYMMHESGSDGIFFWWYPGGYRVNEMSDFGIINPDGTDRPVTKVIREEGPRLVAAPKPPKPDVWIAVDRDKDARGLFGIYQAVKDEYWKLVEEKKTVGLKWEREPGKP